MSKKTILLISICTLIVSCTAAPVYKGPTSDHFNGKVFVNRVSAEKGLFDLLKLGVSFPFKREDWPDKVATSKADEINHRIDDSIAATVINHSTVLIQMDGLNILTDPVFSRRASPFGWAGPKRVTEPAVSIPDLPPIDVILISHNHYDHLDIASLTGIIDRPEQTTAPMILAGLGNSALFEKHDITNHHDLDWGQSKSFNNTVFEFVETRHRSGRGFTDQMKTLWGGFVISGDLGNVYFGGDTGYGPHFSDAKNKFKSFELALIPIGAYEPRWFMSAVHLNPDDAVKAHQDLNSQFSIAIHHSTFQLTYESIDQPKLELAEAMTKYGVPDKAFSAPSFGKRLMIQPAKAL